MIARKIQEEQKKKKKKKMKTNKITLAIGVSLTVYMVIDIIHFFVYRIYPVYPTLTEAFYESYIISFTKWLFCVATLAGVVLDRNRRVLSFNLMLISAIGVIALFVLKGQLNHLIRGSVVFKIGLLEITMFTVFIYSTFFQVYKLKIKARNIILSFFTGIILGYIIHYLPVYNLG